jgi:hypothetical protein
VVNRRLTDRSISGLRALALGLGAAMLALLTQVLAQEPFAATRLRGSLDRAGTPPDTAEVGAAFSGAPAGPGTLGPASALGARTPVGSSVRPRAGQRATRARFRRSRAPTTAIVRQPTQLPTASPNVAIDIQPRLVGIPDPAQPAALAGRASTVSTTIGARETTPSATFGARDTAVPLVLRGRRLVQADPYGPVGVRLGTTFLFFPAIEQSFGYDDNPNRASGRARQGSAVSRTEAELRVQSDWSRHELTGYLRGAYTAFPNVNGADRPDAEGRITLRVDASRDTQLDAETHFRIDTERPGNPNLVAGVAERPINSLIGGSTGVTHRFNRLSIGLRGTLDREDFEDARLADGTVIDQSDRAVTSSACGCAPPMSSIRASSPSWRASSTRGCTIEDRPRRLPARSRTALPSARLDVEITRTLTARSRPASRRASMMIRGSKPWSGRSRRPSVIWSASPLTTC